MVFEKKRKTEIRYIKMENWYVVLTPIGNGAKQIFKAQYYENGLEKLTFKVSATYRISRVKETERETKLKEEEIEKIVNKMKEFLKIFRQMDKLEEMEKKSM